VSQTQNEQKLTWVGIKPLCLQRPEYYLHFNEQNINVFTFITLTNQIILTCWLLNISICL
jgi:hypothetical protein